MNFTSNGLTYLLLSLSATLFLSACDGGKSRSNCSTDPSSSNCTTKEPTNNECPAGEVINNGVCQKPTGKSCPDDQKLENDICVDICPAQEHIEEGICVEDDISIEIVSKAACASDLGKTQIIMQFIARNSEGRAIDPKLNALNKSEVLETEILIDGESIDFSDEAATSFDSKLLKSDAVLSLVLDSSGSMLNHTPPAFEPMKAAAISILKQTKEVWKQNESKFDWQILWFNDYLYKPALNLLEEPWAIDDINKIPTPKSDSTTELYKAVNHMISVHKGLYNNGTATKARDQHIMIVLSDGKDTHSWFDNRDYAAQKNIGETLFWTEFGSPGVSFLEQDSGLSKLEDTLASIPPNLRIHVIGFGEEANINGELEALATYGNGLYFYGSSADNLKTVFEDVQKEFITIQTIGMTIAKKPGTYSFTLKAKNNFSLAEGSSDEEFTVEIGPNLPKCVTE